MREADAFLRLASDDEVVPKPTLSDNNMTLRQVLTLVLLAFVWVAPGFCDDDVPTVGTLRLRVAVVSDDLTLKPVPKWQFSAIAQDETAASHAVNTDFDGKAELSLPPGLYSLTSSNVLAFEHKTFRWDVEFTITPGTVTHLELSNDNAQIEIPSESAQDVQLDEGSLYNAVKSSVFKVLAEAGHGSGFLVRRDGLIATNHHVVADSRYLAVTLDRGRKYPAKLVTQDPVNDIAIIQINPELVGDLAPLTIADDSPEKAPCEVGERVVAIGSPFATDTILTSGLVSKVEQGAIFSDVSINPGNSGGPLFNMRKEVVGINTFRFSGSSGIGGVVRGYLAKALIASVTSEQAADPPPAEALPTESDFTFPAEDLRELALTTTFDPRTYHVEVGKFDAQLITPLVLASLEVESEKQAAAFREKRSKARRRDDSVSTAEYEPGKSFYEWRRYVGDYRPVVTLQAVPEIGLTGGSTAALIFAGMAGTSPGQLRYKFKADFDRMELLRGGVVVQPIHPGRSTEVVDLATAQSKIQDIGYYGHYEYPPEAFRPGEPLVLRVWKQGTAQPIEKAVPATVQAKVWQDFEPYFRALEAAVDGGEESGAE